MPQAVTVSQAIRHVKAALEETYPDLWVEGELANVTLHSSGHCYATLKDAQAQVSWVMFRDNLMRLRFRPENGLKVLSRGRFTLYAPQGRFQMVANSLQPVGQGDLQLAFEQLKARLEKEGLFAAERKRPIPAIPRWIAIITSIDGAALHDMLTVLHRRFAGVRVLIHPARVQGQGAAADLANAIGTLNREFSDIDVILLGRGGGSIEDLWAFNEEVLARAMAASLIPIISCVGHETDFTIADFVADLRAPTPSAAAELVIHARADLVRRLENATARLRTTMHYRLQEIEQRLDLARLSTALQRRIERLEQEWRRLSEKLHLLSPLATLSRGYAIAFQLPERRVLKRAEDVTASTELEIQLQKGKVYAQVQRTIA